MIYTVYINDDSPAARWQSGLLEFSWGQARQPGELVCLSPTAATGATQVLYSRRVETLNWSPHPYTGDVYPSYNMPASLLEWLFSEPAEGTILLLDRGSVFISPVSSEVQPGQALASPRDDIPRGDGPFGLSVDFGFLNDVCVDRSLSLPQVGLPLLIHSDDLRRISARWLELTSIIRSETLNSSVGARMDADRIAFAIAAAEADIPITTTDLSIDPNADEGQAPILDTSQPVLSTQGDILFDMNRQQPVGTMDPAQAASDAGQALLSIVADYASRLEAGADLAFHRPCRRRGIREGRILDRLFIETPGRSDTLSLNASGAAIWALCDGNRSLAELARHIEDQFNLSPGAVNADVRAVIDRLKGVGALDLKPA